MNKAITVLFVLLVSGLVGLAFHDYHRTEEELKAACLQDGGKIVQVYGGVYRCIESRR